MRDNKITQNNLVEALREFLHDMHDSASFSGNSADARRAFSKSAQRLKRILQAHLAAQNSVKSAMENHRAKLQAGKTGAQLLRERFEEDINSEARLYNLMPSDKPGQTYWSLHTERAWQVYKAGMRYGAELVTGLPCADSKESSHD